MEGQYINLCPQNVKLRKGLTAMPCRGDGLNYEVQTVQDEKVS